MHNVILVHGYAGSPTGHWFPYVARNAQKSGFDVWAPALPGTDNPTLVTQLRLLLTEGTFTPETVLIGHSAGCALILALLEEIAMPVHAAILVAGFASPIPHGPTNMLKNSYDWNRIRSNVKNVYIINSDNDPWGCTDVKGREIFDHLGGTLIIRHGEGHFGSDTYAQPYPEFPLVAQLMVL